MSINMNLVGRSPNFLGNMPILRMLGFSLGLGLMSPACSSPDSKPMGDSGYHPTVDTGVGGRDSGIDSGLVDAGRDGGLDAGDSGGPGSFIRRVSVGSGGIKSNGGGGNPPIHSHGRG